MKVGMYGKEFEMNTNELTHPASWRGTLLALGPFLFILVFLLIGLLAIPLMEVQAGPAIALGITLGMIGVFLIIMLAGWVKNFPRWVLPYWGFVLILSLYVYTFTGTMAGYWVTGDWWAWAPVAGVAVVGSLLARGLRPVYTLFKTVWRDWTSLSFVFYGALPWLFVFAYDEVRNDEIALAAIMLILGAGAIFYMRAETTWHRLASLVGGFSLGWILLMVHQSIYWNNRQDDWMPRPGSWKETLNWTSQFGVMLMLILVAPVLVEVLRRAIKSRGTPKPAS
jgi:hypothetical protein